MGDPQLIDEIRRLIAEHAGSNPSKRAQAIISVVRELQDDLLLTMPGLSRAEKGKRRGAPKAVRELGLTSPDHDERTLIKVSKHYKGQYYRYWWDISPAVLEGLRNYEKIGFKKVDGDTWFVSASKLREFLIPQRQTTRGHGNWGVFVLDGHPDELAFEPGQRRKDWLFLRP